jgi:NifB/MoaA-like Fe-S oxidoreductase
MNPELRVKLLRNRFAGKIVEQVDRLAKAGIELHCQAVLVPNENDGEELAYTARKLFSYYPTVKDLACVPTGLTKFREGLYPISDVDGEYSKKLLDLVDSLNKEFGVDFLLPADEYFVKAGRDFKPAEFYGEFEQIENGIGMTSKFLSEVTDGLSSLEKNRLKKKKRALLISGVSAEKVNKEVAEKCMQTIANLEIEVLAIENDFFGKTVTCTGLLTGVDIFKALQAYKNSRDFDEVILPGNTLKEFEDVFLCGMTVEELKQKLAFENIQINREGGYGLVDILMGE